MPISPKDIQSRIKEREKKDQDRIKKLEEKIDAFLLDKAPEPGQQVQYALPMNEPLRIINGLMKSYQSAGWDVERYEGSQRDACNDLIIRNPKA